MGVAIAEAAAGLGADVELVLGPSDITPENPSIKVTNVTNADSMAASCMEKFQSCDIAILSAAVADFTPVVVSDRKMKKTPGNLIIELKPTTDIALTLGKMKRRGQILAGFALETDDELENARAKLKRKNLDMIVLNSLKDQGAGFGHNTNKITIIDRNNNIDKFGLKSKEEAALDILTKIMSLIKKAGK